MRTPATVLAIAAALACGIVPATAQNKPAAAKPASKSGGWETGKPMTFYIAQGAMNSCGEGCREWIAAEGSLGPNSADRLRALLKRSGQQQLPIFFNSPGGLRSDSFKLGRLLRERGMTAGVGLTIPEGCPKPPKEDDKPANEEDRKCDSLKQSGKKLQAELITAYARCSSACGYAFLGAKKRVLAPGARIGIHSGQALLRDGNRTKVATNPSKQSLADRNKLLRQYVREMGIDNKLVDAAEKIPYEKIHYLTREELVAFRIDTREIQETPWMLVNVTSKAHVAKFWVETTGMTKKEFPTNMLRFYCSSSGNRLFFAYYRGLSADKSRAPQIELTSGGNRAIPKFQESKPQLWIESERTFESYYGFMDSGFAEAARKEGIELKEIASEEAAPRPILKLSPAGWDAAVEGLKCGSTS